MRVMRYDLVCRVRTMLLIALAALLYSPMGLAQEVKLDRVIGNWSIYCSENTTVRDCSLVTGAVADDDAKVWVKIAFAFSSPSEIQMTVRTPHLSRLKLSPGVSIAADDHHLGRVFIQDCYETSCQTTVALDPRIFRGFALSKVATFAYPTAEREGEALAINFEQFVLALNELAKAVFPPRTMAAMPVEGRPVQFRVELRKHPTTVRWGKPLKTCHNLPASKVVSVSSNFEIAEEKDFDQWLDGMKRCDGDVAWISSLTGEHGTALGVWGQTSKFVVYQKVKEKMPYVVTKGPLGEPQQPSSSTTGTGWR